MLLIDFRNSVTSMPTKIIDSFCQCLPHIDSAHQGYRSIAYSSKSTIEKLPPPIFLNEHADKLATTAREYLQARQNDPDYLSTAKAEYLAPKENGQVLLNEADVARASGQQLINPVNIVLQDIHRSGIQVLCNSEVVGISDSAIPRSGNSKGKTPPRASPDCRFDIRWAFTTSDTTNKGKKTSKKGDGKSSKNDARGPTFAILEFKNTDVLFWGDFEPASCTAETMNEKLAELAEVEDEEDEPNRTFLLQNAEVVSRQAVKYSSLCPDIALFDWNSMFIYDFSGEKKSLEIPMGTFFKEQQDGGITFREMLLGFLLRALAKHGELPAPSHAGKALSSSAADEDVDGDGAIDSDIVIIKDYLNDLGPLAYGRNRPTLVDVSNYVLQGGDNKQDLRERIVRTILWQEYQDLRVHSLISHLIASDLIDDINPEDAANPLDDRVAGTVSQITNRFSNVPQMSELQVPGSEDYMDVFYKNAFQRLVNVLACNQLSQPTKFSIDAIEKTIVEFLQQS